MLLHQTTAASNNNNNKKPPIKPAKLAANIRSSGAIDSIEYLVD